MKANKKLIHNVHLAKKRLVIVPDNKKMNAANPEIIEFINISPGKYLMKKLRTKKLKLTEHQQSIIINKLKTDFLSKLID